jgi:DNA-binding NarL/FixJ family response regulator
MVEVGIRIKVAIADNQPLYRKGIRSTLAQLPDIEICGEVSSGKELLAKLTDLQPDVLLLDTELSHSTETARTVKQHMPTVSVVLMTSNPNDDELFDAIRSRASGYLKRDVSLDELVSTIRKAAAGQHPINETLLAQPQAAKHVLEKFQDLSWGKGAESFVSPLTPRETEILNYMAQGYFNKQIAVRLSISEQTIKNHITSILRKLDANARTEAVITAIKRGLITLSK